MNPSLELALAGSLTDHAIKQVIRLDTPASFLVAPSSFIETRLLWIQPVILNTLLSRVGLARWLRSIASVKFGDCENKTGKRG
jgi:hypothetical protein